MDSLASPLAVMCEVCGTYFETRRGLSSHARLHLRQLGVTLSESSGAPINLLYQLIQERDGSLPDFKVQSSASGQIPLKKTSPLESMMPGERTPSVKAASGVSQKMDDKGSPARPEEPAASLLPSSPSGLRLVEPRTSDSIFLGHQQTPTKPLWAPLETDAPITLDTKDEVHVCQLCGCWYGSRKGLSTHARAHLRHIGFQDSEIKGSPLDLLYQIMEEEDLKPISIQKRQKPASNSAPGSSSKRPLGLSSTPTSPPSKRPKEDRTCVLCGEEFENRKGLACHARCHLRQMGIFGLMGKISAIDTIQELIDSGVIEARQHTKTNKKKSSSAASSPAPAATALSPVRGQSRTLLLSTSLSPNATNRNLHFPADKAPKAKKGFRLAVDPLHRKPKPESVEFEVSAQPKRSGTDVNSSTPKHFAATVASKPFHAESSNDLQSPPEVLCDFCGQLFETRKALSCHARAHLRQLGLSWSIKTSPIDLLHEVMMRGEEGRKEFVASGSWGGKAVLTPPGSRKSVDGIQSGEPVSKTSVVPLDYSMKEKSLPGKSLASNCEVSCELCGFDFENRKALASHARAHLRQLGVVEWKTDGASSPIELLSELIRRDPAKVTAITQRYRRGDLYIKKRASGSPCLSTDSEPGNSQRVSAMHHEHKRTREDLGGSSRHTQGHTRNISAHCDSGLRSPRGVHPPKHAVAARGENRDTNSQQPPRSGSIPAMLPNPPLTPLVKLVGKIYSLKCRFCEEVFHGPLSVQEQWITHLQKHILSLGYKGKAPPPPAPVTTPALVRPVAV